MTVFFSLRTFLKSLVAVERKRERERERERERVELEKKKNGGSIKNMECEKHKKMNKEEFDTKTSQFKSWFDFVVVVVKYIISYFL